MAPYDELRYLILAAQREGNRTLAALLAPARLTPAQAEVLTVLATEDGLTLAELGRRLVCETGSPSRLVDTLVRAGLVDRATPEADRRQVHLSLTTAGSARAVQVRELETALTERLRQIPRAALDTTIATLRHLVGDTVAGAALDLRRG